MIKINKILCPVDFFPASIKAAHYASRLAAISGASLRLLHVVPPMIPTAYKYPLNMVDIMKATQKTSENELKSLVTELNTQGLTVETAIVVGDVRDELKRAITTMRPDVVAMGTHGRLGVRRWVMGSTTEWMIRHSPVPVLTISAKEKLIAPEWQHIMVTTDFSDGTPAALSYALSIALANKSRVSLVHIADPSNFELPPNYRDILLKGLDNQLKELIPRSMRDRYNVETKVKQGVPYRMILEIVKIEKPDLLVMNIHGKNMVDRVLLGSTAERVVRAALCPVLLVPPVKKAEALSKSQSQRAA